MSLKKAAERAKKSISKKPSSKKAVSQAIKDTKLKKPQSKAYSLVRDAKKAAKPLGWRYTNAGAKKLGVSAKSRPTKAHIEQYADKTMAGGQRFLYQETRVDKSDVKPSQGFARGGKVQPRPFLNSNLELVDYGVDYYGNQVVKVKFTSNDARAFRIQSNANLPFTHKTIRGVNNISEISMDDFDKMEKEITDYIEKYGSKKQKQQLKTFYANGGVPHGSTLLGNEQFSKGGKIKSKKAIYSDIFEKFKRKDGYFSDLKKTAAGNYFFETAFDNQKDTEEIKSFVDDKYSGIFNVKDSKYAGMKSVLFMFKDGNSDEFADGGAPHGSTLLGNEQFAEGGEVEPYKREISLGKIDYNGRGRKNHEVSLKIELRNKEEARDWDTLQEVQNVPELSISGNVWNTRKTDIVSGGQNDDTIREYFGSNPKVRRLIEIWNEYHLNDMKTGTIRQTEAVEKAGIKGREYDYNKAVEHLKEIGLYEDNGYKYGHGWLYQPIPESVIAEVKEIAESFPAFNRYEEGGMLTMAEEYEQFGGVENPHGSTLMGNEQFRTGGLPDGSSRGSDTPNMEDPLEFAKGGSVDKIANIESASYTENLIPFVGSNLEGKVLESGDYVVLSYGYYPIWLYSNEQQKWFKNKDKYSVKTSKQTTQSRPTTNYEEVSHNDMLQMMNPDKKSFDLGGIMVRRQFPMSVDNINVAQMGATNMNM